MARSRVLKPGFFSNDDLLDLGFDARLLYAGLWTIADREGRLEDRPRRIKIDLFPADAVDVDDLLGQLAEKGFLHRYEVAGQRLLHLPTFLEHQSPHPREAPSKLPACGCSRDPSPLGCAEALPSHEKALPSPSVSVPVSDPVPIPVSVSASVPVGGGGDEASSGEREIYSTALGKLPTKFQYDARTIDEMRLFAKDYAGCHMELAEAIAMCQRNRELCFPGNLRKYMPPLEGTDPVAKFRDNPIIAAQKAWKEANG